MVAPPLVARTWSAVLFDLDGTIIDSAPGLIEALARMHESLGLEVPSDAELLSWIGPPFLDSMRERLGLNEVDARRAREMFRDHYRQNAISVAAYPGVVGVLEQLHAAGIPIALATSKPEVATLETLCGLNLLDFFTVIVGADEDVPRSTKQEVVAETIRRLDAAGVDTSRAVMVGDRSHDIIGAAAHGAPTIMVEWGYGSPDEAAGALALVHSADQLRTLLLG